MSKFSACALSAKLIQPLYFQCIENNDKDGITQLEYEIGCGIFQLPKKKKLLYNGYVSKAALENGERCADHMYPRKISAYELLNTNWDEVNDPEEYLKDLYWNKFGKYNYVTKDENNRLVPYQRRVVFTTWREAYSKANIQLVECNNP